MARFDNFTSDERALIWNALSNYRNDCDKSLKVCQSGDEPVMIPLSEQFKRQIASLDSLIDEMDI